MDYDLIIIGAGWAGFNAAAKAKKSGLKVALIEKDKIGGTCLNYGCIPTKSLIHSAGIHQLLCKSRDTAILPDMAAIHAKKDGVVRQLGQGMKSLLSGIDFFEEEARLAGADIVKIGERRLKSRFILIATGSRPAESPGLEIDGAKFISSNQALELRKLPASLLIVGAGAIGCEFASLFAMLGVKVTILEKMPQLLPGMDQDVARKIETIFRKRGIGVVTAGDLHNPGIDTGGFEKILVCIGRRANTAGLGLEKFGITVEKGRILTDGGLKTGSGNIYAAGDCTSEIMLAHWAAYQGELAVANMASGAPRQQETANIPACVFTSPEIAAVGMTEKRAAGLGIPCRAHRFDFLASGMARILEETEGFIKILSDKNNGRILGAAVIGPHATELIGTLSLAVSNSLGISEFQRTIFAHPTLSESLREALKE